MHGQFLLSLADDRLATVEAVARVRETDVGAQVRITGVIAVVREVAIDVEAIAREVARGIDVDVGAIVESRKDDGVRVRLAVIGEASRRLASDDEMIGVRGAAPTGERILCKACLLTVQSVRRCSLTPTALL